MADRAPDDFWRDSGFHLLRLTENGHLAITDDFFRAYLSRPELKPVPESCDTERRLHAMLIDDPWRPVTPVHLVGIKDKDARENYQVLLRFRDRLAGAETLEAAYLSIFSDGPVDIPPLFLDHMVHIILRRILDGTSDPMLLRAGECLFREQSVTTQDGNVLVADSETVEMYAATGGFGSLGQLLRDAATPIRSVELDVLTEENRDIYWQRDTRFDTVLDISFTRPGLDALCRVLERWVLHFLGARVSIQPVQRITDEKWTWHVGLDAESSSILNDLYQSAPVSDARLARLLSLFRLEFADSAAVDPPLAGRPVYLGMAMSERNRLRLKPQNLLVNLPLARRS